MGSIEKIVDEAYSHYIERIGCKPAPMTGDYTALVASGSVWVLTVGDSLAGLIVLRTKPNHLLVSNVAVGKTYQGQGYGRQLLDHADALARQEGNSELHLYTNELTHENLKIYLWFGLEGIEACRGRRFPSRFHEKNSPAIGGLTLHRCCSLQLQQWKLPR
ncbi:GNAT family N-acetyltransferase [Paracoccus rhizosphaerae]|uniref:GNAT family N-acetyltransferase n=1 Tax=Paracoccus rhizosphaerae TaxID=1133347 RepID=UPI0036192CCC